MKNFETGIAPAQQHRKTSTYGSRILWIIPLFIFAFMVTNCRGGKPQQQVADEIAPANLWMFSPLHEAQPVEGVAAEKVSLGRRLYYENHLSENGSLSCNSCHVLANYGVDKGQAVSVGHLGKPGGRNSPTVYNAALQFVQFWDGRAPTLAAQASGPMMNPAEMGMPGPEAVLAVLQANPEYVSAFHKAYPDSKGPVTMENVTDSIARFESGLLTPARWDDYLQGEENALSTSEKDGLRVYLRAGCAACHAGTGMGGNSYQKLGAFQDWPDQKSDRGRFAVTGETRDSMFFKVPLLRNVEQTSPYFHNGQVATLREAVRLMGEYQTGHNLSADEISSILSFLHALTGPLPSEYIQAPEKTGLPQKAGREMTQSADHRTTAGEGGL